MHRHNQPPASEDVNSTAWGQLPPRRGHSAGSLGTLSAQASAQHLPPLASPGINGHDLMAMFPAKSPYTVRTRSHERCTVFTEQERAFFARSSLQSPATTPPFEAKERRLTYGHSTYGRGCGSSESSASTTPLSARELLPDGDPIMVRGKDRRPLAETPGRDGGAEPGSAKRRSRATTCADPSQLNSQRVSREPVPGGSRRPRTRRASLKFVIESSPSDQSENDRFQGEPSVTAVHARRVDKKTGITFIETEYRRSDDTLFIMVNQDM